MNRQFAWTNLGSSYGRFCGIVLNRLMTTSSGGSAPLTLKLVSYLKQKTYRSIFRMLIR